MMAFCKTITIKRAVQIIVGIIIGFLLTTEFRSLNYENFKRDIIVQLCRRRQPYHRLQASFPISTVADENKKSDIEVTFESIYNLTRQLKDELTESDGIRRSRSLLLVGVMTAKQYIDTRSVTIWETWAKDLGGHVLFFTSEGCRSSIPNVSLPLVALPGVDDSYPPQKKSFLMLKFMHDHFGERYKFFMRADDDVYLHVHRMRKFLRQLNSSQPIFLGQTGVGNDHEFGQLSLLPSENFCMGGPGIVMSHRTLSLMAPNIGQCLAQLYSTHEDVELGRCVRRFAGTSCTWSYDMQRLFYHNSSIQQSILAGHYPAKELFQAITIHPVKDPEAMRRLYIHYNAGRHQDLRYEVTKLTRKFNHALSNLNTTNHATLARLLDFEKVSDFLEYISDSRELGVDISLDSLDVVNESDLSNTWQYFSSKLYSAQSINPKRHIEQHISAAFNANIQRIMQDINHRSITKSRVLDYHSIYYGYVKFSHHLGVRYIIDLLMIYRKFEGKRITIPLRRHAYAVQTFSETKVRQYLLGLNNQQRQPPTVNIIVPLAGRLVIFRRFIENLIKVHHQDSFFTLTIVYFPKYSNDTDQDNSNQVKSILAQLQAENPQIAVQIIYIDGSFSRGVALQKSLNLFDDESLLFFLDVDMNFDADVLSRVRRNTIIRQQVYFPIVFSQYSNQVAQLVNDTPMSTVPTTNFKLFIGEREGYWRQFGFGIVSLHKCDLLAVGGYDLAIAGWGMEDVSLYDRFVTSNLTIFRAVDPGLVHVYHEINCDNQLSPVQFEMCLGTKLSSLDSTSVLAEFINRHKLL